MPRLPWAESGRVDAGRDVVVMASRFVLRSPLDVPGFLLAALRIRRQVRHAPSALGVALDARLLSRTFYTLSAWEDRESIAAMVGSQPHRSVMQRYRSRTAESTFRFWNVRAGELPVSWEEARQRLAAIESDPQDVADGDRAGAGRDRAVAAGAVVQVDQRLAHSVVDHR
jgi:hypothetical protein